MTLALSIADYLVRIALALAILAAVLFLGERAVWHVKSWWRKRTWPEMDPQAKAEVEKLEQAWRWS